MYTQKKKKKTNRKSLCFTLDNNYNIVKMAHLQHPIWNYDIL